MITARRSLQAMDRRRIASGLESSFAVRESREGMRGLFSGYTTRYRDSGRDTPPASHAGVNLLHNHSKRILHGREQERSIRYAPDSQVGDMILPNRLLHSGSHGRAQCHSSYEVNRDCPRVQELLSKVFKTATYMPQRAQGCMSMIIVPAPRRGSSIAPPLLAVAQGT